jgi:hypothetical protein
MWGFSGFCHYLDPYGHQVPALCIVSRYTLQVRLGRIQHEQNQCFIENAPSKKALRCQPSRLLRLVVRRPDDPAQISVSTSFASCAARPSGAAARSGGCPRRACGGDGRGHHRGGSVSDAGPIAQDGGCRHGNRDSVATMRPTALAASERQINVRWPGRGLPRAGRARKPRQRPSNRLPHTLPDGPILTV